MFFGGAPPFQIMYLTGETLLSLHPESVSPLDDEGRIIRQEELYEVTVKGIRRVH